MQLKDLNQPARSRKVYSSGSDLVECERSQVVREEEGGEEEEEEGKDSRMSVEERVYYVARKKKFDIGSKNVPGRRYLISYLPMNYTRITLHKFTRSKDLYCEYVRGDDTVTVTLTVSYAPGSRVFAVCHHSLPKEYRNPIWIY